MSLVNMEELETSPDTYWGIRVRQFIKHYPDEPFEKLKEALLNDAAVWSIFAALLMTVAFSALTISTGDFDEDNVANEIAAVIYVLFNTLAGGVCHIKKYFFSVLFIVKFDQKNSIAFNIRFDQNKNDCILIYSYHF